MSTTEAREAKRSLGAGILPLPEEDLTERHHGKVFVEVPGESGPDRKEIGELSWAEIRTLEPGLRIRVVNRLLERYLAEQTTSTSLRGGAPLPMTSPTFREGKFSDGGQESFKDHSIEGCIW